MDTLFQRFDSKALVQPAHGNYRASVSFSNRSLDGPSARGDRFVVIT